MNSAGVSNPLFQNFSMADDRMEISSDHGGLNAADDIDIDIDITDHPADEDYVMNPDDDMDLRETDVEFGDSADADHQHMNDDIMVDDASYQPEEMHDEELQDISDEISDVPDMGVSSNQAPETDHNAETNGNMKAQSFDTSRQLQDVVVENGSADTVKRMSQTEPPQTGDVLEDFISEADQIIDWDSGTPNETRAHPASDHLVNEPKITSPSKKGMSSNNELAIVDHKNDNDNPVEASAESVDPDNLSDVGDVEHDFEATGKDVQEEWLEEDMVQKYGGIMVRYQEANYALFPLSEEDDPDSFFLKDFYITKKPIPLFLKALREVLQDEISKDDELCIGIEVLLLEFGERSKEINGVTFEDLVNLYHRILHNDGIDSPGPMHFTLGTRPEFSPRFVALTRGAGEGKGLSELVPRERESEIYDDAETSIFDGEEYPQDLSLTGEENEVLNEVPVDTQAKSGDEAHAGIYDGAFGGEEIYDEIQGEGQEKTLDETRGEVQDGIHDGVQGEDQEEIRDEAEVQIQTEIHDQVAGEDPDENHDEVSGEVQDEAHDEARDEIQYELPDEFEDEIHDEIQEGNGDEVRDEIQDEIQDEVRDEIQDEGEDEIQDGIKDEVTARVQREYSVLDEHAIEDEHVSNNADNASPTSLLEFSRAHIGDETTGNVRELEGHGEFHFSYATAVKNQDGSSLLANPTSMASTGDAIVSGSAQTKQHSKELTQEASEKHEDEDDLIDYSEDEDFDNTEPKQPPPIRSNGNDASDFIMPCYKPDMCLCSACNNKFFAEVAARNAEYERRSSIMRATANAAAAADASNQASQVEREIETAVGNDEQKGAIGTYEADDFDIDFVENPGEPNGVPQGARGDGEEGDSAQLNQDESDGIDDYSGFDEGQNLEENDDFDFKNEIGVEDFTAGSSEGLKVLTFMGGEPANSKSNGASPNEESVTVSADTADEIDYEDDDLPSTTVEKQTSSEVLGQQQVKSTKVEEIDEIDYDDVDVVNGDVATPQSQIDALLQTTSSSTPAKRRRSNSMSEVAQGEGNPEAKRVRP